MLRLTIPLLFAIRGNDKESKRLHKLKDSGHHTEAADRLGHLVELGDLGRDAILDLLQLLLGRSDDDDFPILSSLSFGLSLLLSSLAKVAQHGRAKGSLDLNYDLEREEKVNSVHGENVRLTQ